MGQYLFVVLPGPDPLLILTLLGLLVGGEWWFRRVFYIARFVLLAWDRAARFNSVRTADIAGRLLFPTTSYAVMREIEIILDFFVYKLPPLKRNLLFSHSWMYFININNFHGLRNYNHLLNAKTPAPFFWLTWLRNVHLSTLFLVCSLTISRNILYLKLSKGKERGCLIQFPLLISSE